MTEITREPNVKKNLNFIDLDELVYQEESLTVEMAAVEAEKTEDFGRIFRAYSDMVAAEQEMGTTFLAEIDKNYMFDFLTTVAMKGNKK